ncbi:hypothetical protein HK104_010261 [Borealophlyctis nickersoniae]|nr:hypothetical protein HK104_010261 [Borealophlyctis nickersoniae]
MSLQLGYLERLKSRTIVLASGSPRRKEILQKLGLTFTVVPSTFPEDLDKSLFATPAEYVRCNAIEKAKEVHSRLNDPTNLVIGADTIVVLDDRILEKPRDTDDARRMLRDLSGRSHHVMTAVALVFRDDVGGVRVETLMEDTEVEFGELDVQLIEAYVSTGEPM